MKWIYGKQDWKTLERGMENCWLLTDGLGGYSSLTVTGAAARGDHALFMACVRSPGQQVHMLHRLRETLERGEQKWLLSTQEFADGSAEEGFRNLVEFSYEDTARWRYVAAGVEVEKEAAMKPGSPVLAIRYRITNRTRETCCLTVTPFYQLVPRGSDLEKGQDLYWRKTKVKSRGWSLFFKTNGSFREIPEIRERYYYRYDICDGRRSTGQAAAGHQIFIETEPGAVRELEILYSLKTIESSAAEVIWQQKRYRKELARKAGFAHPLADFLARSADQFVAVRDLPGSRTILAGFPCFGDWGRDTMIALPGLCLATRQYERAREILRTFASYEKDGLMPNYFLKETQEPVYDTADAALLFINCVWQYWQDTGDERFVCQMYPVMERIIQGYCRGTRYAIHMDEDGLICAGEGEEQVTWMNMQAGEILPTPRQGKPVEINAYWYNALRCMEAMAGPAGKDGSNYGRLALQVRRSFAEKFWMEEKHCLKDLLSGSGADEQIRCNQIWAVSMPFTMLDPEQERQIVDVVFEKLYTPYGLRTLEEEDPQFHPVYSGVVSERDLAYHQGTVWVFPLGAYYLAYLKVHGEDRKAKETVRNQLEVLESALREGCCGQLPEIYDGGNPISSKGCFAKAWSVGELLRVFEKL